MQNIIYIILAALVLGEVALFALFFRFFNRFNKAFKATKGSSLVSMLNKSVERSEEVEKQLKQILEENKVDRQLLNTTFHKMGFVRFNPFGDMGGEQSFALALLDGNNSGILITTLYGKDNVRTYAKKVVKGNTKQKLSAEEEQALQEAMGGL